MGSMSFWPESSKPVNYEKYYKLFPGSLHIVLGIFLNKTILGPLGGQGSLQGTLGPGQKEPFEA